MTEAVRVTIPGEPVAMSRPRFRNVHTKDGRNFVHTYNPSHVQKWQLFARKLAAEAMGDRPPYQIALQLTCRAFLPIPLSMPKKRQAMALAGSLRPTTRPDADNYLKAVADSLLGVVYRDDSQLVEIYVSKHYSDRPRIEVVVLTLDAECSQPVEDKQPMLNLRQETRF